MQFKTELIHSGTLSPRETEVMLLVCDALTDKDISRALAISLNTVARHLEMVYIKLGVHGSRLNRRVSMTRVALAEGMVRFLCALLAIVSIAQAPDGPCRVNRLHGGRSAASARRFD